MWKGKLHPLSPSFRSMAILYHEWVASGHQKLLRVHEGLAGAPMDDPNSLLRTGALSAGGAEVSIAIESLTAEPSKTTNRVGVMGDEQKARRSSVPFIGISKIEAGASECLWVKFLN